MSKSDSSPFNLALLQSSVDDLAAELGRSVAIDNPSFELVCASAQIGPIDNRRIDAIIHRSPPPEPVPWMLSFGINKATEPIRLPENPEFEMLPRICFPIRFDGKLMAYLWLFDVPAVTDHELLLAQRVVDHVAQLLSSGTGDVHQRAEKSKRIATKILSDERAATAEAVTEGYLEAQGALEVFVIRLDASADSSSASHPLQEELSRRSLASKLVSIVENDRAVIITRTRAAADSQRIINQLRRALLASESRPVGLGSAQQMQGQLVSEVLAQALFASRISGLSTEDSVHCAWEKLGGWKVLYGWDLERETIARLSNDAEKLIAASPQGHWETVLTFLDHGRNTTRTSEALFIHRASLHYRLSRAREILGDDAFDDGWRSTVLHAALKLHQALERTEPRNITD